MGLINHLIRQKGKGNGQSSASKQVASSPGLNTLYGIARKLQSQLTDLEAQVAIVKRDVARIDRKVYRDEDSAGKIIGPVAPLRNPGWQFDPMTGMPVGFGGE